MAATVLSSLYDDPYSQGHSPDSFGSALLTKWFGTPEMSAILRSRSASHGDTGSLVDHFSNISRSVGGIATPYRSTMYNQTRAASPLWQSGGSKNPEYPQCRTFRKRLSPQELRVPVMFPDLIHLPDRRC